MCCPLFPLIVSTLHLDFFTLFMFAFVLVFSFSLFYAFRFFLSVASLCFPIWSYLSYYPFFVFLLACISSLAFVLLLILLFFSVAYHFLNFLPKRHRKTAKNNFQSSNDWIEQKNHLQLYNKQKAAVLFPGYFSGHLLWHLMDVSKKAGCLHNLQTEETNFCL